MKSDFENYEDDDVIAVVLAFRLLKKSKRKNNIIFHLCSQTNEQRYLLRLTNHSLPFQLVSGMKLNMPVSGTRKIWHQKV